MASHSQSHLSSAPNYSTIQPSSKLAIKRHNLTAPKSTVSVRCSNLERNKFSFRTNLGHGTSGGSRGLFVANVSASAGMPDDGKKISFEDVKETTREIWERCPQPVKVFPWRLVVDNFIQLILDAFLAVVKILSVPLLAVTSVSEFSYCAHERKLFLTPIPLIVGMVLAGVLKETLLEVSPVLKDMEVPWHLLAITICFTILKLPGPYYPYWGRIFIPHVANGVLLMTLWFAFWWYRRPRNLSAIAHRNITTDILDSTPDQ